MDGQSARFFGRSACGGWEAAISQSSCCFAESGEDVVIQHAVLGSQVGEDVARQHTVFGSMLVGLGRMWSVIMLFGDSVVDLGGGRGRKGAQIKKIEVAFVLLVLLSTLIAQPSEQDILRSGVLAWWGGEGFTLSSTQFFEGIREVGVIYMDASSIQIGVCSVKLTFSVVLNCFFVWYGF